MTNLSDKNENLCKLETKQKENQPNKTKQNKTPEQTTIKQQQQRLNEFELKRKNKELKNRMATSDCKLHNLTELILEYVMVDRPKENQTKIEQMGGRAQGHHKNKFQTRLHIVTQNTSQYYKNIYLPVTLECAQEFVW